MCSWHTVVAVLGHQHLSQEPRPGQTPSDRTAGRCRLYDLVTPRARQLRPHLLDDLEMGGNVLQNLRDICAQLLQRAATVRAGGFLGQDRPLLARQMSGQRPACRLPPRYRRGRGLRRLRGRWRLRGRRLGRHQLVELQLQLLDLPRQLLRPPPELQPLQLGNEQLEAGNLRLPPCQFFLLRIDSFCLYGEGLVLSENERAQSLRVERGEIRQRRARTHCTPVCHIPCDMQ